MAASPVAVVNSALIKVGAERIDSLTDSNPRAIICNEQYAKCRDDVLIAHPWNFAIDRASLSESLPVPIDGFEHKFALPSDVLRVLSINEDSSIEWAIEGEYLHTDESSVKIKYIKQVTDTTIWSASFDEVLALRIAAEICYSLKKDASQTDTLWKLYKSQLAQARSFDAQEGYKEIGVESDQWLNSRL